MTHKYVCLECGCFCYKENTHSKYIDCDNCGGDMVDVGERTYEEDWETGPRGYIGSPPWEESFDDERLYFW